MPLTIHPHRYLARPIVGAIAVLVLITAACSGGEPDTDGGPATTNTTPADATPATPTTAAGSTQTSDPPSPSDSDTNTESNSESSAATSSTTVFTPPDGDDFGRPGPFPVGIRTTSSGRGLVDIWYPAVDGSEGGPLVYSPTEAMDRAAPVLATVLDRGITVSVVPDATPRTDGPFPLLIHSHALGGYRRDLARHLRHLASWGYVVVAPDHPERSRAGMTAGLIFDGQSDVEDLRAALALMDGLPPEDPLTAAVNTAIVAVEGHSVGARAVLTLANSEPRINAQIALAPVVTRSAGIAAPSDPHLVSLVVAADADIAVPLPSIAGFYGSLPTPKRLVVLEGTGHSTFIDACGAIRTRGGLMDLAETSDLPDQLLRLSENGCQSSDSDPLVVARVVDHLAVAHLRLALSGIGSDRAAASLSTAYVGRIAGRVLESYIID